MKLHDIYDINYWVASINIPFFLCLVNSNTLVDCMEVNLKVMLKSFPDDLMSASSTVLALVFTHFKFHQRRHRIDYVGHYY